MPLTTTEIELWLKLEPNFLGVFPLNKLPTIPEVPKEIKIVINTDSDNLPGTHWIAVWRKRENHICEIFDSFGTFPPAAVQLWCGRWIHNSKCVQNPTSTLCGIYCIMFITSRDKFKSLEDCVDYLSKVV